MIDAKDVDDSRLYPKEDAVRVIEKLTHLKLEPSIFGNEWTACRQRLEGEYRVEQTIPPLV